MERKKQNKFSIIGCKKFEKGQLRGWTQSHLSMRLLSNWNQGPGAVLLVTLGCRYLENTIFMRLFSLFCWLKTLKLLARCLSHWWMSHNCQRWQKWELPRLFQSSGLKKPLRWQMRTKSYMRFKMLRWNEWETKTS